LTVRSKGVPVVPIVLTTLKGFIMSQKVFTTSTKVTADIIMSVKQAVDILTAIANRNDTAQRFQLSRSIPINNEDAWGAKKPMDGGQVIPIEHSVMAEILGPQLGLGFSTAMTNPAYEEYFNLINERLMQMKWTLVHSAATFWFLIRVPEEGLMQFNPLYSYSRLDLLRQRPNGFLPEPKVIAD